MRHFQYFNSCEFYCNLKNVVRIDAGKSIIQESLLDLLDGTFTSISVVHWKTHFLSSIFEHLYQGVNGPISFWENVSKRYIIDEGETEFLLPFAFLSTLSHFNRYLHNAIKKVMFVPTKAKNTNPWESKCIGRLTSVRKLVTNYPKIYDLDQG